MSVSVGCLARIYIGEIPYLQYFMEHYINIGVDQFYLVVNDESHVGRLEEIIKPYQGSYTLIVEDRGRNVNRGLQIDIEKIKTDYLISIDVDEFIYLDVKESIGDFLEKRNIDTALMKWIMSPRDFIQQTGEIRGFKGHTGKKLARTKLITGIAGPHNFEGPENLKFKSYNKLNLVHYWGRSYEDMVIKCLYQNLPTSKKTSAEEMAELLKERKLPERMRVLASLMRHDQDVVLEAMNHTLLDPELERQMLSVASADFLDDLKSVYIEYKDSLDYAAHVDFYPDSGSIYRLAEILP